MSDDTDMEHMRMRWKVDIGEDGAACISCVGSKDYLVAEPYQCLPGDKTGERTARAIVDAHNASLDAEANKTKAAVETPTLRDQFAMAALTTLVWRDSEVEYQKVAGWAYDYADAMMKARDA